MAINVVYTHTHTHTHTHTEDCYSTNACKCWFNCLELLSLVTLHDVSCNCFVVSERKCRIYFIASWRASIPPSLLSVNDGWSSCWIAFQIFTRRLQIRNVVEIEWITFMDDVWREMQDYDCKSEVQDGYLRRRLLDGVSLCECHGIVSWCWGQLFWIKFLLKCSWWNSRVILANGSLRICSWFFYKFYKLRVLAMPGLQSLC